MSRRIDPPLEELEAYGAPPAVRQLAAVFEHGLAPDWEIYVQPHMNGRRPSIVLLNPRVGVAIFRVVDVMPETGLRAAAYRGLKQVELEAKEVAQLYCCRLGEQFGSAAITAGLIFPTVLRDLDRRAIIEIRARAGWSGRGQFVFATGTELERSDIDRIFPLHRSAPRAAMTEEVAVDLRTWLVEPDYVNQQRRLLPVDEHQRQLITTRTPSGYRRIRGPAGSGKSLVLAARAAQLASEGRNVLVVTYNITLIDYLRELAMRWWCGPGFGRNITWLNYHTWCKRVAHDLDSVEEYKEMWKREFKPGEDEISDDAKSAILGATMSSLVAQLLEEDEKQETPRYDAVLVDEGQDFRPAWWSTLRQVCRSGGECLLVADATQDVYGTARSWTDETMKDGGFVASWVQLSESYRLPPSLAKLAGDFAKRFLPHDELADPARTSQGELELWPCQLRWVQVNDVDHLEAAVCREILSMPPLADPEDLAMVDVTLLADTSTGRAVLDLLKQKEIRVVHTYDRRSSIARQQKFGFSKLDARVKATTIHSFKGWEARSLVVVIEWLGDPRHRAAIYSALTRIKRHSNGSWLTVVCADQALAEYGRTWPDRAAC